MNSAPTFAEWLSRNEPGNEMHWRGAAANQFREIEHTMSLFGTAKVVSSHRSKSISLPVVQFEGLGGLCQIRDNFYGLNVAFNWKFAPGLMSTDVDTETRCFAEGMVERPLWKPGSKDFMVYVPSWDHARVLMRKVWNACPPREVST